MKIINSRLHGMLDYLSAMVLLFPWFSNYYTGGPDTRILAALGGIIIIVSLLTDYEFGLIKMLPMKVHLVFDVICALFLIAMLRLFPVYHYHLYWPVLLGAGELLVVLFSSSETY